MESNSNGQSQIEKLDLNTTVELVLQFLKDNNLSQSFHTLSEEAGVTYNQIPNREEFLENIMKGFWHQVLKQIQFITIDKAVLLQLYSHIIKELLIQKEVELAQYIIKEQTFPLLQDFPDQLQQLWDLTYIKDPVEEIINTIQEEYDAKNTGKCRFRDVVQFMEDNNYLEADPEACLKILEEFKDNDSNINYGKAMRKLIQ